MTRFLQLLVVGAAAGGVFALLGMGITVLYKATRVPNFAFAAMGTVAAVIHWDLTHTERGVKAVTGGGMGYWPALLIALAVAAVLGLVTEFLVRPLQGGKVLASLVLTLGWMFLLLAGIGAIWGNAPKTIRYALRGTVRVPGLHGVGFDRQKDVLVLVLAVVVAVALTALFKRTRFGLAVRAVAEDRDAAQMMGININRVSQLAWVLGSVLAALTVILIVPPVLYNPYQPTLFLVYAFGAALLGGFNSLWGTFAGGLLLGIVPSLLSLSPRLHAIGGLGDMVRFGIIIGILVRRPAFIFPPSRGDEDDDAFSAESEAALAARNRVPAWPWVRRAALVAAVAYFAIWIPMTYSNFAAGVWAIGLTTFLLVVSLVVLAGWTGQIPLSQAAFVGIGAFMVNNLVNRVGLPDWAGIPLAALSVLPFAIAIGLPSLRLKGLYFAIASIGFLFVASSAIYGPQSTWFTGQGDAQVNVPAPVADLVHGKPTMGLYLVILAITATAVSFARNIHRSRVGRAFTATRDSEVAARSLGIDPARFKLTAFALSGVLAGLSGATLAYLSGVVKAAKFDVFFAISYLLYAVVGGVQSLIGAGLVIFLLDVKPALDQKPATGTSNGPQLILGLLVVLLVRWEPGGLAAAARRATAWTATKAQRRRALTSA